MIYACVAGFSSMFSFHNQFPYYKLDPNTACDIITLKFFIVYWKFKSNCTFYISSGNPNCEEGGKRKMDIEQTSKNCPLQIGKALSELPSLWWESNSLPAKLYMLLPYSNTFDGSLSFYLVPKVYSMQYGKTKAIIINAVPTFQVSYFTISL